MGIPLAAFDIDQEVVSGFLYFSFPFEVFSYIRKWFCSLHLSRFLSGLSLWRLLMAVVESWRRHWTAAAIAVMTTLGWDRRGPDKKGGGDLE